MSGRNHCHGMKIQVWELLGEIILYTHYPRFLLFRMNGIRFLVNKKVAQFQTHSLDILLYPVAKQGRESIWKCVLSCLTKAV